MLFDAPTVAGLAERISEARGEDRASAPRSRAARGASLFRSRSLSSACGSWSRLEPNSAVYNISSALRLAGYLDVSALEQSLQEIVRRHESLRTIFTILDTEPVQVIHAERTVPLPLVDLCSLSEAERNLEAQGLIGTKRVGRLIWNVAHCFVLPCCDWRKKTISSC